MSNELDIALNIIMDSSWRISREAGSFRLSKDSNILKSHKGTAVVFNGKDIPNLLHDDRWFLYEMAYSRYEDEQRDEWEKRLEPFYMNE